jgi:hypothetical protein
MATDFAALEDRTARATLRALSNASIDLAGSEAVAIPCILDDEHTTLLGAEASAPQLLALSSQVAGVCHQDLLTVRRYRAAEPRLFRAVGHEPDGTGLTRIVLERAS